MASAYFKSYDRMLQRLGMVTLLDEFNQGKQTRRLSIVGPCLTHEQWRAVQTERRREASAVTPRED